MPRRLGVALVAALGEEQVVDAVRVARAVRGRHHLEPGRGPVIGAAGQPANFRDTRIPQVARGQRGHTIFLGDQHHGPAVVRHRGQARSDRPVCFRDVTLAVGHGGPQVEQARRPVRRQRRQGVRREAVERGHCRDRGRGRGRGRGGCGRRQAARGRDAAFQNVGLVAELAQPARGHRRAHRFAVEQHQARAAQGHPVVGRLDQLAARRVHRRRHAVAFELLGRAHVEKIGGAVGFAEPSGHVFRRRETGAPGFGQLARACSHVVEAGPVDSLGIAPGRATFQFEPGQEPALGAVLQRLDRVRHAEVDQSLSADNGARAPGAVDHDPGLGIGRERGGAQGELAVGTAQPAGHVHLVEFLIGPAVEQHQVRTRRL